MTILQAGHDSDSQTSGPRRELPTGCFCSTGLKELQLPRDFHELGAHACENCKLLHYVDISDTNIEEIREFTFVHSTRLHDVRLPHSAHNPPKGFYGLCRIARTGHPTLTALRCQQGVSRLHSLAETHENTQRIAWSGTCAEENAFALCPAWRWPQWLHMIRDLCVSDLG